MWEKPVRPREWQGWSLITDGEVTGRGCSKRNRICEDSKPSMMFPMCQYSVDQKNSKQFNLFKLFKMVSPYPAAVRGRRKYLWRLGTVNTPGREEYFRGLVSVGGCSAMLATMSGEGGRYKEIIIILLVQARHHERRDQRTGPSQHLYESLGWLSAQNTFSICSDYI